MADLLPDDKTARKALPITTGVIDYFPRALAAIAAVSVAGNQQHNPGEPLHWAKEKSTDHADCIARHLIDRGKIDTDGGRHSAKLAWRALALLEIEMESGVNEEARSHLATEVVDYAGGWIAWNGGECPVDPEQVVEYKRRNSDGPWPRQAGVLKWNHTGDIPDIIAYRVLS